MKKEFADIMDRLFGDLNHEMYELEAELNKIKDVSEETFKRMLLGEDLKLKEYERLIGVMYRTSQNESEILKRIHTLCIEALRGTSYKPHRKAIMEMIKKVKEEEKKGLGYASRLPFSIGAGWKASGETSTLRQFINIPGYLLMAPYLLTTKKAVYNKQLYDIKALMEKYREKQGVFSEGGQNIKNELKASLKDFRIFIRITNRVHRALRRLKKDCRHLYKDLTAIKIDEDIVYEKDSETAWSRAV